MLKFNFKRIITVRGISKPFSYLINHGYSANIATRIANNRVERLDLNQFQSLCELFQCTPNDLMEWVPDAKDVGNKSHPLAPLKREQRAMALNQMIINLPLDRIAEIQKLIKNELEK